MKNSVHFSLLFLSLIAILSVSCKKGTTTPPTNQTAAAVTGNWNLDLWDGAAASGTLVFAGSNFTLSCTTFGITDNGTYSYAGSNYTFAGTGVMNGGNTWVMDTLTSNVLKMHSSQNLIVRATK